jgi:hypothetical protein
MNYFDESFKQGKFENYDGIDIPHLKAYWNKTLDLFIKECAEETYLLQKQILDEPTLCKILSCILRKGVTFPNEIANELGIDYGTVSRKVVILLENKLLERVPVSAGNVHPLLERRMEELWGMGIKGEQQFKRRHWVTIATPDMGGFFTVDWFHRLFLLIGNKLGQRLVKS